MRSAVKFRLYQSNAWRLRAYRLARERPVLPPFMSDRQPFASISTPNLRAAVRIRRHAASRSLVADALDLVEAGNRVAHMPRVVQRLLALLREGEGGGAHPVSLLGADPRRTLRASPAVGAAGGSLLASGGHWQFLLGEIPPQSRNASAEWLTRQRKGPGPVGPGPAAPLRRVSETG